jgi:hypothetical protein
LQADGGRLLEEKSLTKTEMALGHAEHAWQSRPGAGTQGENRTGADVMPPLAIVKYTFVSTQDTSNVLLLQQLAGWRQRPALHHQMQLFPGI